MIIQIIKIMNEILTKIMKFPELIKFQRIGIFYFQ